MEEKVKKFDLEDAPASILPMGYKEIHTKKIPPLETEDKLLIYNKRYKYGCYMAFRPNKPVSKILK